MAMNPRARRRRSIAHRSWSGPRPSPTTDPRRARRRPAATQARRVEDPRTSAEPESPASSTLDTVLDDFTESWDRGEHPRAEGYLGLLSPADAAELIYHEFCLAESSDLQPEPTEYLRRFPELADSLTRLFALHGALPASTLRAWVEPTDLPSAGDEIGPYQLVRELGRGSFARVFLAEQADLDHRLVVVKVSTRSSAEPRLLARARHPHIVEVLRHVAANDGALHLVCMPFLGGATLASVLDRRRARGRRSRTGRELLADLDRSSAPEYPAPGLSRPTREVIAGLSDAGALAWIIARLAEALDHAQRRGVVHGDLKPSNILLTAEAAPMLFDFNLAVDSRLDHRDGFSGDAGGTLAYMAPERLRSLAGISEGSADRGIDLHRADLYALGLVLLEALTGRAPEVPRIKGVGPIALAESLARSRLELPGPLRGPARRVIPSTLRSILTKCLAPDPADRYARGNDLAEDLDRWRTHRPLVFVEEPRYSGLTRRVRRGQLFLVGLALTMVSALAVGIFASISLQGTRRDQSLAKLSMIVGRTDSGAFGLRLSSHWRPYDLGDPAENAARQLARYDVATNPDWRTHDDVRALPDREREELEAWLLEQVLRRAVALGERPNAPEDWRRALALLDQTLARTPSTPIRVESLALRSRLNLPEPEGVPADAARAPSWLEDYLAGVAAEPLHAREALGHYLDALRSRPELFWAHYRAAVVACRIDEFPLAVEHLRQCLARHPENPVLHAQLASTLYYVQRLTPGVFPADRQAEALRESDQALALDPDFTGAHMIRAILRQGLSQEAGVQADLGRFGLLTRSRKPSSEFLLRMSLHFHPGPNSVGHSELVKTLTQQALELEPGDHETRALLANGLAWENRPAEAIAEYDRVLKADPNHLRVRYQRAVEVYRRDRASALAEFAWLIDHPRFEEVFHEEPTALRAFHYLATDLVNRGEIAEARKVANRGLEHAHRSRSFQNQTIQARNKAENQAEFSPLGESYYLLARIHSVAAQKDRDQIPSVIDYLDRSFAIHEKFRKKWYANDPRFDHLRGDLRERLASLQADR